MTVPGPSPLFRQFVDDELLRAPMLFDQVLDAVLDGGRRNLSGLQGVQRNAVGDMLQAAQAQRTRLAEYFLHSLREQVQAELRRGTRLETSAHAVRPTPKTLALVDEDEVAIEVELSHAIEGIKSTAEYELRELQTFVAAMVGDLDMAQDHNPFRPVTYARATWAAAQALPMSRGHQIAFMRQCAEPLAQLLRTSYAASTSRLESQGVEPAAYRTLILPSGSRRGGRSVTTTYSPDLQRMSETMPAPLDTQHGARLTAVRPAPAPARTGAMPLERWTEVARGTTQRADRQAVELVSRLFEAMIADRRVPQDVMLLIARLHGPAMRLALRDRSLLDHDRHPLWRFVNQLAFVAEMAPEAADPERQALLRTAQATIDQLSSEQAQHTGLYRWAWERLQAYLDKRLKRRLATLASQIGALQNAEQRDGRREAVPSTLSGPLDAHQLDTVPAEFIDSLVAAGPGAPAAEAWLASLVAGDWVRMFINGRWLQAQLLWQGERAEFWLFGDGSSDETWAVRRRALALMHDHGLVKTLRVRSVVGSAAQRVQQDVAAETAA